MVLCLRDMERAAAGRLDPATLAYFAGGAGDGRALAANERAFARRALRPRALAGAMPDPSTSLLGRNTSLPVLAAPVGLLTLLQSDGERASVRAAAGAGVIACTSWIATATHAELAAEAAAGRLWSQIYPLRDRGLTADMVARAADAGFEALVVSVDGPTLGRRETAMRAGFTMPGSMRVGATVSTAVPGGLAPADLSSLIDPSATWEDIATLARSAGLPLVVKGVLTGDDAALAVEHGAAVVIVSNHGGRQLDAAPSTLDVLEEVVGAVAGRAEVLLDGGVRRGTDVLVALALGARAVLIGRPVAWGLAVAGEAGVARVFELLHDEIRQAMGLCGVSSLDDLTPARVALRPA